MLSFLSGDWLSTIHILGAVQGLFLAALLFSKRRNAAANKFLAVAMLAFSLDLFTAAFYARGYEIAFPHFIGGDFLLALLYGPVLYLYVQTVGEGGRTLRKKHLLHFVPFVLVALYLVPFYLQPGAEKLALIQSPEDNPWTSRLTWINHFKIVYSFVYLVGTFWLLKQHRQRIKRTFSSIEHINLIWLRNLMLGGLSVWGIAVVFYLLALQSTTTVGLDPIEGYDDVVLLAVAIFVYVIGYLGLRQPEIFSPPPPVARSESDQETTPSAPTKPKARYAKSGMDPDVARHHLDRLRALMEGDKPYRNPHLTLQDLAESLSISAHNLSEVINTQRGQSFYDFVNAYRIEDVQQRLADARYEHLTLLAIGLDAGFNSKSSFNAVFKKHTAMTPSQYKKQILQKA